MWWGLTFASDQKICETAKVSTRKNFYLSSSCFGDIVPPNFPVTDWFKFGHQTKVSWGHQLNIPLYIQNVTSFQ